MARQPDPGNGRKPVNRADADGANAVDERSDVNGTYRIVSLERLDLRASERGVCSRLLPHCFDRRGPLLLQGTGDCAHLPQPKALPIKSGNMCQSFCGFQRQEACASSCSEPCRPSFTMRFGKAGSRPRCSPSEGRHTLADPGLGGNSRGSIRLRTDRHGARLPRFDLHQFSEVAMSVCSRHMPNWPREGKELSE